MRENVFTFALPKDEQQGARAIAERCIQQNSELPVGDRVYLGPGARKYVLRLLSVEPNPATPEVTVYKWELSGMGRVSNIAELVAANGGDPVVKLNG